MMVGRYEGSGTPPTQGEESGNDDRDHLPEPQPTDPLSVTVADGNDNQSPNPPGDVNMRLMTSGFIICVCLLLVGIALCTVGAVTRRGLFTLGGVTIAILAGLLAICTVCDETNHSDWESARGEVQEVLMSTNL